MIHACVIMLSLSKGKILNDKLFTSISCYKFCISLSNEIDSFLENDFLHWFQIQYVII